MKKLFKFLGKMLLVILLMPIIYSIMLFVLSCIMRPINEAKINSNFEEKLELRKQVIEKIQTCEIQVEDKRAILSEEDKEVSSKGYVYVHVSNEDETVIEFIYHGGFPDEGQSFIYSSGGEELIKKYINESLYHYIDKFADDWYFVQFR